MNFMMLLYPNRDTLDTWAKLGNDGWDYDSLSPYFRKFATVHAPPQSARDVLGLTYHDESIGPGDGPIQLSFSEGYGPTNKAWMDTFSELGLTVDSDPRQGAALGAFQNTASIDPVTKTRSYAVSGYLDPSVSARPNLTILTETTVRKIIFDTSHDDAAATGVEVLTKDGKVDQISAKREVILAAGSLQTPQILELSGIGDSQLLTKHGIPVIVDNPNVGENLQDHPVVCQSFEVADGVPSGDVLRDPAVLQALLAMYQNNGDGPLGQSNISVAYTPRSTAQASSPPRRKPTSSPPTPPSSKPPPTPPSPPSFSNPPPQPPTNTSSSPLKSPSHPTRPPWPRTSRPRNPKTTSPS